MAEPALKPETDGRHPRLSERLIGHGAAEDLLLSAYASGRLPHGWLITGPRGVGKATLAYRFARFLLENGSPEQAGGLFGAPPPPVSLDIPMDSRTWRLMAQGGHPGLTAVERAWDDKAKRLRGEIVAPISMPADRKPKIRPAEPGGIIERTSMSREGRMLPSMIPAKAKVVMMGIVPKSDQAMASMADAEAT